MYYLITSNAVIRTRSLSALNKKMDTKFLEEDFERFGSDRIINPSNEDLEFKRDLAQMDRVAVNKLYKKDLTGLLVTASLVLNLFILLQVAGVSSSVSVIAKAIQMIGGN